MAMFTLHRTRNENVITNDEYSVKSLKKYLRGVPENRDAGLLIEPFQQS